MINKQNRNSQRLNFKGEIVEIKRSNRKSVAIEITKDAKIIVRSTYFFKEYQIIDLLEKKEDWIKEHLLKVRQQKLKIQETEISLERIRFLSAQARLMLPERIRYYAEKMGVSYGKVTIRHQKTRWGSCSAKGNLNFNCMLMAMPKEIQDYVIVHELCHRKEMNHSPAFWKEVEAVLPDYKQRREWLKKNGNTVE